MRLFKKLRQKLSYLPDDQIEEVRQAYLLALQAHRGQKRQAGDPYIAHPVSVACILADMKMDMQTIIAALLHDVLEDTCIQKQDIIDQFGDTVASLVDGVTKLTQIEAVSRIEVQAESFRKMVLAMSDDMRVILVKLADRLHNMRTLGYLEASKRRRIARETLDIFARIAKRLGMRDLSVELEELSFMNLYPQRYQILKDAVRRARGSRKKILGLIHKTFQDGIRDSQLMSCTVMGREKHLYSIYRKMRQKQLQFREVMDVYAFRLVVDTEDACYQALGLVHRLFKPVPGRFKDYIAIPKANGYQSLHTILFGPYGLPIEVQIRTTEMERVATNGIAAHWIYKGDDSSLEKSHQQAQRWLDNLLEFQKSAGTSVEFVENVKVDLFPDEVYVFTPKGDIKQMPLGSTAVDFAYAVHTDVGNACVSVKIDRQLAPLSSQLANGQTVDVITSANARPHPAWLNFVVTSKARSGIRHYLKNQKHAESILLGKRLLKAAFTAVGLSERKIKSAVYDHVLKELSIPSLEDLHEKIGLGHQAPGLVAQRFLAAISDPGILQEKQEAAFSQGHVMSEEPIAIKGTEKMVVHYSHCCYPIPGDPIAGVFQPGQGLMVHADRCPRMVRWRRHPEQVIPLCWSESPGEQFIAKVQVQTLNEQGILGEMALAIAEAKSNIEDIAVEDKDGSYYIVTFKLTVTGRSHLAQVMRRLRQLKHVTKMNRSL